MERFSKKRQAIYDCLQATKTHPSADWLYARLKPLYPDLSLATIYRNLNMMKEEGIIISVGVVNGQERFDADITPHTHMVCEQCSAVVDIPLTPLREEDIRCAELYSGCRIHTCTVQFTGLCVDCISAVDTKDTKQ